MHTFKLRSRLAQAASLGVAAAAASLMIGAATASAAPPDPTGFVAPHFFNGNVSGIRDSGSDTTFFMMQKVADLFTGAGLYGCTLNLSSGQTLFNPSDPASSSANQQSFCTSGAGVATTDIADNWDRTEVTQGVDDVGSGAGQNQLCGAINTPLPVDFARSSKPAGSIAGCAMVQTGYAKDGVPVVDFPINPNQFGTSTNAPYSAINGGVVGPVSSGWLPGDSPTGPFTGTKLTSISNADNGGAANSTAYRLWCATGTTRITDWGELTNLGPKLQAQVQTTNGSNTITLSSGSWPTSVVSGDAISGTGIPTGDTLNGAPSGATATLTTAATATGTVTAVVTTASKAAVGQGLAIGIPVRIMGVNTASGTESTFTSYQNSGVTGSGACGTMNTNAASDPNPNTNVGNTAAHVSLENNAAQIAQYAVSDWPNPDFVDQAIETATTLYIESNGVFNTNPFAAAATINGLTFSSSKLSMNGVSATGPNLLSNAYPTARTLFNIYNANTVRASTGGFLNWICDANTNFLKAADNSTGKNFDTELTTVIGTNFGFPRLSDTTGAAPTAVPADGIAAPNDSCSAALSVTTTSGSPTITLSAGGNFPADIVNAGQLPGSNNDGSNNVLVQGSPTSGIPSGDFVQSGAGTSTLTLSAPATATGTTTVVFLGVPSVTAVANANS